MTDGPTNPIPGAPVSLVERVKNILLSPKTEWPRIAAEPATVAGLFTGYALIVAAIPAVASILGSLLIGLPIGFVLATALVGYAIGLGIVFIVSLAINEIATGFGGTKNQVQATKLAVYSSTPVWIVGILNLIPQLFLLMGLLAFVAIGYGAYLIYLGATPVMRVPQDKAIGYAAVIVLAWIVIYVVLSLVLMGVLLGALGFGMMAAGGMPRY
ncbi:MAG: Yip1 family protein [Rhodoplanes sp.]